MKRWIFLVLLLTMGFRDDPLGDEVLESRAMDLFEELGCPVCEGQSLGGSSSEVATSIRNLVREKLAEGESEEEVVVYLEERYGSKMRLSPPFEGVNVVVWLLPMVIFFVVLGVVWFRARRD